MENFMGDRLQGSSTLGINGPGIHIVVTVSTRDKFTFHVSPFHRISDVKRMIEDREKIPIETQELVYGKIELQDTQIHIDFDDRKPLALRLLLRNAPLLNDRAEILVKTSAGKLITLSVSGTDTILLVKKKLHDEGEISPDRQHLWFRGQVLENGGTLAYYKIQVASMLYLASSASDLEPCKIAIVIQW